MLQCPVYNLYEPKYASLVLFLKCLLNRFGCRNKSINNQHQALMQRYSEKPKRSPRGKARFFNANVNHYDRGLNSAHHRSV